MPRPLDHAASFSRTAVGHPTGLLVFGSTSTSPTKVLRNPATEMSRAAQISMSLTAFSGSKFEPGR